MNETTTLQIEDLENRFTYHAPKPGQPDTYTKIRTSGLASALVIEALCPECEERNIAFRKLEEAVMWANAAIARHG